MISAWRRRIIGRLAWLPCRFDGGYAFGLDGDATSERRSSVGPPVPVGRIPSMAVEARISRTTWPACTSWIVELVLMISRCARHGSARALMSSGMT